MAFFNEFEFYIRVKTALKKIPERDIILSLLNASDINLYFVERIEKFLDVVKDDDYRISHMTLNIPDEALSLWNLPKMIKKVRVYPGVYKVDELSMNNTFTVLVYGCIDSTSEVINIIEFRGLFFDTEVSLEYFETRWTLQMVDGMDALAAHKAAIKLGSKA